MEFKLLKQVNVIHSKEDKKEIKITNFFLQMANGTRIRILPNIWTDKNGVKHYKDYELLDVLAEDVTKLPFED